VYNIKIIFIYCIWLQENLNKLELDLELSLEEITEKLAPKEDI